MLASFSLNRYPEMVLLAHMTALFIPLWRHLQTVLHHALLIYTLIINEGEYFFSRSMPAFTIWLFCFHSGHYFERGEISQLLLTLLYIPAHPQYSAAGDLSFVGVQRHFLNDFLSSLLSALIPTLWGFSALLSGPLQQVFISPDWQRENASLEWPTGLMMRQGEILVEGGSENSDLGGRSRLAPVWTDLAEGIKIVQRESPSTCSMSGPPFLQWEHSQSCSGWLDFPNTTAQGTKWIWLPGWIQSSVHFSLPISRM